MPGCCGGGMAPPGGPGGPPIIGCCGGMPCGGMGPPGGPGGPPAIGCCCGGAMPGCGGMPCGGKGPPGGAPYGCRGMGPPGGPDGWPCKADAEVGRRRGVRPPRGQRLKAPAASVQARPFHNTLPFHSQHSAVPPHRHEALRLRRRLLLRRDHALGRPGWPTRHWLLRRRPAWHLLLLRRHAVLLRWQTLRRHGAARRAWRPTILRRWRHARLLRRHRAAGGSGRRRRAAGGWRLLGCILWQLRPLLLLAQGLIRPHQAIHRRRRRCRCSCCAARRRARRRRA